MSMDSLRIIPSTLNDIPLLLSFMEKFYAIDGYSFNAERTRSSLNEFISHPDRGTIWIINLHHRPIGYIILAVIYSFEFGGKNAFVDEFYLEPEYRRKGTGTKVMEFVSEEARTMNITALHLEVERHNAAAIQLYHNFQFRDHERKLMTRMVKQHE